MNKPVNKNGFSVVFFATESTPERTLSAQFECYLDAVRAAKAIVPTICHESHSKTNHYRFWRSGAANLNRQAPIGEIIALESI